MYGLEHLHLLGASRRHRADARPTRREDMTKLRSFALAAGLCVAAAATAFAAGLFPNFPIVGGAAYCGGYSTGVAGQVCTVNVPAGPTALTGNELIPADTQLSQGQAPQTVLLTPRSLNGAPITYNLCAAAACGTIV